jgi:hypothetical protein
MDFVPNSPQSLGEFLELVKCLLSDYQKSGAEGVALYFLTKQRRPTRVGKHHAQDNEEGDYTPYPFNGFLGVFMEEKTHMCAIVSLKLQKGSILVLS